VKKKKDVEEVRAGPRSKPGKKKSYKKRPREETFPKRGVLSFNWEKRRRTTRRTEKS